MDATHESNGPAETRSRVKRRRIYEKLRTAKDVSKYAATASAETQAEWLWSSYMSLKNADPLQEKIIVGATMIAADNAKSLERNILEAHKDSLWKEQLYSTSTEPKGSPLVIIVSSSAGAANLISKKFPFLKKASRVAKLFAKHFKVEAQEQELNTRRVNIATGTPNRLVKLADRGSLKLNCLRLLVLDVQLDTKERSLLDVPEVHIDFWTFFKEHLQEMVALGQVQILLVNGNNYPRGKLHSSSRKLHDQQIPSEAASNYKTEM